MKSGCEDRRDRKVMRTPLSRMSTGSDGAVVTRPRRDRLDEAGIRGAGGGSFTIRGCARARFVAFRPHLNAGVPHHGVPDQKSVATLPGRAGWRGRRPSLDALPERRPRSTVLTGSSREFTGFPNRLEVAFAGLMPVERTGTFRGAGRTKDDPADRSIR